MLEVLATGPIIKYQMPILMRIKSRSIKERADISSIHINQNTIEDDLPTSDV